VSRYLVIDCPHCGGNGKEPHDGFMALATLGMSIIVDKAFDADCSRCDGSGQVYATQDDLRQARRKSHPQRFKFF